MTTEWYNQSNRDSDHWIHYSRRRFFLLFVLVLFIFLGVSTMSYNIGRDDGRKEVNNTISMPKCEEDEYLYPEDDYKGPGKNKPSEYTCVHIDEAVTGVVEIVLDTLGLYDPETGSALIPPYSITKGE